MTSKGVCTTVQAISAGNWATDHRYADEEQHAARTITVTQGPLPALWLFQWVFMGLQGFMGATSQVTTGITDSQEQ
ncbi:hypothetical protein BLS_003360 [Venturia inaequalis]|uniref:Uncharacterized protein n=1 Tax=Venturia inaequalis TaxID=5025 RepID=A0A8H3VSA9_VENIN|nr:hypothetical protein BLS_003360 [Venturia inaequalis]KAE9984714.1 hypothetical protein EG328_008331 [Venturia inaequalis]KAE9992893.1 hypothetical protein EG327_007370 [Venturia inaequalis]RDI85044.1 hypothetical protein Vi05172_g4968 [Venturia inaequalis]